MKLTKTDYRRFLDCPGEFWLSHMRKDLLARDYDRDVQFRIRQGYEVQKLAEDWLRTRGEGDFEFQRTVETTDSLARLDAYLASADGAWVVEIKSSTQKSRDDSSKRSDRLTLLNDIGYQVLVAREAGERVVRALLATVNPQFELDGEIDFDKFFVMEDVLDEVDALLPEIADGRRRAIAMLSAAPEIDYDRLCTKKLDCEFVRFLKDDVPPRNVGQIPRITNQKVRNFAEQGVFSLLEVPGTAGLSDIQKRYVETAKLTEPMVLKDELRKLLHGLVYPLHFLDYESVSCPIPMVTGMRPWQQFTFQYSMHILDAPGSEPTHFEFVSDGSGIAPLKLAGALSEHIGKSGTVLVWNKAFEKGRNSEMGTLFPEYGSFFDNVNDRIFDLKDVFDDGLYRHPEIVNHSIKNVLPVIAPELDYHELEIGNGGTASAAWYEDVLNGDGRTKERTLNALRDYCGLDTLAMVRIFSHLASEAGLGG